LDVRGDLAVQVAESINGSGGGALPVTCDVAVEAQVAAAVVETVKAFDSLNGLVANAGTAGFGWIHETGLEDWQSVLGVNLTGAFLCAKHAIPHMFKAGKGSIVVTSSIAGSVICAGGSAASYAVSKAGIIQLQDRLPWITGPRGSAPTPPCPPPSRGATWANISKRINSSIPHPGPTSPVRLSPGRQYYRAGHARAEYGATIAFLLSDDAGFITGAALPVDGGYLSI
jgi:NAD(P)-dependent dehydrogenase (short-subunit alcohol dehydrogenase family)